MTWRDRLADIPFTIQTGDGNTYTPQMMRSVVEITFNTRDFMYLDERGTYVARKEAQGEVFPLEFMFVGDDHVEQFNAFKESSKDKRPWTITHPFYDEITVQPTQLRFESSFNNTTVTGLAKHTLAEQLPVESPDLTNDIKQTVIVINNEIVNNIEVESVDASKFAIDGIATNYKNLPNTFEQAVKLKDYVRDASNVATQILSKPVEFNESLQALIRFPFEVAGEIKSSILSCKNALLDLAKFAGIDIGLFDSASTALVTSSIELSVDAEYKYRGDVTEVQSTLVEMYETQRSIFEENEYEPDNTVVLELSIILAKALGRLNEIAFNAKKELSFKAEFSASPIIFCHKYYGTSDESLERFCDENKLTVDERILIPSGRNLLIYV